jgi:hypothetical protein
MVREKVKGNRASKRSNDQKFSPQPRDLFDLKKL